MFVGDKLFIKMIFWGVPIAIGITRHKVSHLKFCGNTFSRPRFRLVSPQAEAAINNALKIKIGLILTHSIFL
jgi:hypothetical protein